MMIGLGGQPIGVKPSEPSAGPTTVGSVLVAQGSLPSGGGPPPMPLIFPRSAWVPQLADKGAEACHTSCPLVVTLIPPVFMVTPIVHVPATAKQFVAAPAKVALHDAPLLIPPLDPLALPTATMCDPNALRVPVSTLLVLAIETLQVVLQFAAGPVV